LRGAVERGLLGSLKLQRGKFMLNKILTYGVIAGLVVGVPLFALVLTGASPHGPWGMVIGYLIMLIALSTVFVAVKRHRDEDLGGVIRFWPAFGYGVAISAVAGIIYVIVWETSLAVSGIDFAGTMADTMVEQQRAKGVSGAQLEKFKADMDAFKAQYANPLFRLPITFSEIFPVGLLVSLVSAALLRNSRFMPVRRSQAV
jgi:hypothetical protein